MTCPVSWLHSRGFLDTEEVEAFNRFCRLLEKVLGTGVNESNSERIDNKNNKACFALNKIAAKETLNNLLKKLTNEEAIALIACAENKSLKEIEKKLGLRPRKGKAVIRAALTALL